MNACRRTGLIAMKRGTEYGIAKRMWCTQVLLCLKICEAQNAVVAYLNVLLGVREFHYPTLRDALS